LPHRPPQALAALVTVAAVIGGGVALWPLLPQLLAAARVPGVADEEGDDIRSHAGDDAEDERMRQELLLQQAEVESPLPESTAAAVFRILTPLTKVRMLGLGPVGVQATCQAFAACNARPLPS
jgi:hypothetical protein